MKDRPSAALLSALVGPPVWMRVLVVIAFIDTPLIGIGTAMMLHDVWRVAWDSPYTLVTSVPMGLLVAMLLAIAPRGSVSRWQRAVVVIILAHLAILPLTSHLLGGLGSVLSIELGRAPPRAALVGVALVALGTVGWTALAKRRQVPRAVRAVATLTLTFSLSLALALPVALKLLAVADALPLAPVLGIAAVPAILAALWVGFSDRAFPASFSQQLLLGVVGFVVADIVAMPSMRTSAFFAILPGMHWLITCAALSAATMSALAFMQWWTLRGIGVPPKGDASGVIVGTVESDEPVAGWYTYLGMLRGMRAELASFRIRREGDDTVVTVPAGVAFVSTLPAEALDPSAGDRIPALNRGDRVAVRGFIEPKGGGFREHAGLMVSGAGVHVTRLDEGVDTSRSRWEEVVLAIWRPFVLYVAVVTAGSLPIVVALVLGLF